MLAWLRSLFSVTPAAPDRPDASPHQREMAPALPEAHGIGGATAQQRNQVDYMFAGWLFETEDSPELFTNRTEDAILAELDAVVKSGQAGKHLVQRLPGVIPQLLQSLRSEAFSGAEVARKISHDLVLVAEVLRLANSVAYSPGKPISSIDHAVLVLGHDGLRQLITIVAFKPIINLQSGSFTRRLAPRLWSQSERCAVACRVLAPEYGVSQINAFLAGLIQNIGLTVSLRVIDRMTDERHPVGSPSFCNALAAYGRILVCNIAREWHFPDAVTNAICQQNDDTRTGALSASARVLRAGDYLSKLDILCRHGRIDRAASDLLDDLSEQEIACLEQLALLEERDWVTLAMPAARTAGTSGSVPA